MWRLHRTTPIMHQGTVNPEEKLTQDPHKARNENLAKAREALRLKKLSQTQPQQPKVERIPENVHSNATAQGFDMVPVEHVEEPRKRKRVTYEDEDGNDAYGYHNPNAPVMDLSNDETPSFYSGMRDTILSGAGNAAGVLIGGLFLSLVTRVMRSYGESSNGDKQQQEGNYGPPVRILDEKSHFGGQSIFK